MKIRCNIHYPTVWGEAIYVVGSCPELGIWDPAKAVRMKYFPGDEWKTEVIFHGLNGLEFEYKYILKNEYAFRYNHRWDETPMFELMLNRIENS